MICGICGKEFKSLTIGHIKQHNMSKEEFLSAFPQSKLSWNSGLTKQEDNRIQGGSKKGQGIGHPSYYSKEYLGEERFKEIEANRIKKILNHPNAHALRVKGQKAGVAIRKKNGTYKWKEDAIGRQSVKYFGRTPWTTGLTKYTSDKVKQMSDKMRKYPDKTDFSLFGWTKELRQKIRNRDNWHCKKCGASQKEFKLVLVVHHLDGNKCNNVEDNLITLCRSCHQAVHLEQDVKTGRFKVRKEILSFTIV